MAKGERPLRRARCKQPPEKVGKLPSGKVAKVAKVKKTSLAKATAPGLVTGDEAFCFVLQTKGFEMPNCQHSLEESEWVRT